MDKPKVKHRKKVCSKCGRKLWLRDFYKSKQGWVGSVCKKCISEQKREDYKNSRKKPDGVFYNKEKGRLMNHQGLRVNIFWSPNMIMLLKKYYPYTKNEEAAEIIGVSVRTMIRKSRELGLYKDKKWLLDTREENRLIADAENKRLGYPNNFKPGCQVGKNYWIKRKKEESLQAEIV